MVKKAGRRGKKRRVLNYDWISIIVCVCVCMCVAGAVAMFLALGFVDFGGIIVCIDLIRPVLLSLSVCLIPRCCCYIPLFTWVLPFRVSPVKDA